MNPRPFLSQREAFWRIRGPSPGLLRGREQNAAGGCLVRPSALKRLIKSPDLASYPVSIPRSHRRPLPGQAVACPGGRTAAAPGQWAGRLCFLGRPKTPPGGEFRRDYYDATSADLWRRFILIPLPE